VLEKSGKLLIEPALCFREHPTVAAALRHCYHDLNEAMYVLGLRLQEIKPKKQMPEVSLQSSTMKRPS
jgi:hypothetical protein